MNKYVPTGNEFISLPKINEETGAIEDFTFLSMQYKGMIEVAGTDALPLIRPFIEVDGKEEDLQISSSRRIDHWIPYMEGNAKDFDLNMTILTPVKERGFAVKLDLICKRSASIAWGLKGCWAASTHCVNEDKPLEGTTHCYESGWNHSIVFDFRCGAPLFAWAPMCTKDTVSTYSANGNEISYKLCNLATVGSGDKLEMIFYFGLGFEEVSASTAAKEMLRRGWDYEFNRTDKWLTSRMHSFSSEKITEIYNTNLFFCIFYSTGLTLDTEELVCATSRGTRYYVSAAYWDRDVLLWAFPAILDADTALAAEILHYIFGRQRKNLGVHSRYIDGTVLEPGFELDELMAPIIALESYIRKTGDEEMKNDPDVKKGIKQILAGLAEVRHPDVHLYETFLQPTDDEIVYPYLTYNNVLVWKVLSALAAMYPNEYSNLRKEADEVRKAIDSNCIFENENGKKYYGWSIDLKGHHNIYDEPPGSLELLPYYGFCDRNDATWLNTVDMIRSPKYEYSFADSPIAEIGCAHAPYPWILSLCNSLLCGYEKQALAELEIVIMDNGIACESVDAVTGECTTGAAFATCAGFLCHSIRTAND